MARNTTRRRQSRRSAQLDFAALEITGGLLPTEVVSLIAAGDAGEQDSESYGILKGLKLRDEIARFYQIGLAHWNTFEMNRAGNKSAPISFVQSLLRDCFGFNSLEKSAGKIFEDRSFPVNFAAEDGRIPVIVSPLAAEESNRLGLDEALDQFGDGSRKRSATQLLQEYLNADDEALWGIVTDGSVLRIMRDNASLTRPAWIEINFEKIFQDGLFPDFSATWLILHASRFGTSGTNPSDCSLERWKEKSRLDGAAAKENLRLGVEAALLEIGTGFLNHPDPANDALRYALRTGELKGQNYYEELLRLIYRLIFLFAAEDRNLLHAPNTPNTVRKAYLGGYSLDRLRDRCTRNGSLDQNVDAWEGMKALFEALNSGKAALGLTALGGLFETEKLNNLNALKIQNKSFLKAVWHLSWFRPEGEAMTKVNWRDMETEELGSVYESLLELTPRVNLEGREFTFAEGDETRGNARKTTGSYYTPDSLVKLLLDTTLDPVLDAAEARDPTDPVSEILKLSIIDPACGSGHFLLGAARRTAARVARHRMPGAISKEVFQHALREVVSNCIYGTDRNPMAVELCKVALWIEALEPGKPLSFLDARIQCGDSLIGVFDYEMLKAGIPNEAYKALSGDNSDVARAYAQLNREERDGNAATGFIKSLAAPTEIVDGARQLAAMPEETLAEVKSKARAFARYEASDQWQRLKTACDMYVAAFFSPKTGGIPLVGNLSEKIVPTTESIWASLNGGDISIRLSQLCEKLSNEYSALHWPLVFPAVMAAGGFDAVIGNPPWEVSQLNEVEFFASRDETIASLQGDRRKRAISNLRETNPILWAEFQNAKRGYEANNNFVRASKRFEKTAVGKLNTYSLFAEHFANLAKSIKNGNELTTTLYSDSSKPRKLVGRAGMIVPTGIATDSSTSAFFSHLVSRKRLNGLFDFENKEGIFPGVHRSFKFSVLSIGPSSSANFAFFLHDVAMLEEAERRFSLSSEQIAAINPNTKTAPVFRSRADAELTAKLYSKAPVLLEERTEDPLGEVNPWKISFQQGLFNMASDSAAFLDIDDLRKDGFFPVETANHNYDVNYKYLPLYEGKMIHSFDHRWASHTFDENGAVVFDVPPDDKANNQFEVNPRFWVKSDEVEMAVLRCPPDLKKAIKQDDEIKIQKFMAIWLSESLRANIIGTSGRTDVALEKQSSIQIPHYLKDADVGLEIERLQKQLVGKPIRYFSELLSEKEIAKLFKFENLNEAVSYICEVRVPRWLIGWRRFGRNTDERTLISGVIPLTAVGDNFCLFHGLYDRPKLASVFLAQCNSIITDFAVRQKVGGTNLSLFFVKQFPFIPPSSFSNAEIDSISARVLELTYTSHSLDYWAEDLGHTGGPFVFSSDHRTKLRAELDAIFAKKYELTRDELRYILDPHDVKGDYYPSETFRGLKNKEIQQYGEYRTQRLVLEAFDKMTGN